MYRPGSRPLLPQTSSAQSISFAPPNVGVVEHKKNYVFVDEHNRHKRLKVMRACEGCRRRKIKCDAATTNTWPCAACVRLKLQCVPPSLNFSRSYSSSSVSGFERVLDFDSCSSGDEDYTPRPVVQNIYRLNSVPSIPTSQPGFHQPVPTFDVASYSSKLEGSPHPSYGSIASAPLTAPAAFTNHASFPLEPTEAIHVVGSNDSWAREELSTEHLSDVLGELKIDESGMAPYIYQQKKTLAEAPALEDFDYGFSISGSGAGTTVRIPPALMPDDEQAMEYFDVFFNELYPYVPVISKSYFFQQWHTNRASISPLLLEAIFACAGRMSSDPAQGAQWLALASKHETCFMDVPRLSTIQALLILLKAREAAPKRGYYYRSWMTAKTLVAMARDLDLHEHQADHESGQPCRMDPTECLVKTRIWQTIFMTEILVGPPQGRYEMDADIDSVAFDTTYFPASIDEEELQVSRNFNCLLRSIRNSRLLVDAFTKVRREKAWGLNEKFARYSSTLPKWLEELPPDLQLHYPEDGSAPWLPSHFAGNIHCHYHLVGLMLHRPQLMQCSSFDNNGAWKQHMHTCYDAAKTICRIQEALLQNYGINGLLYMQRGINFAIYTVLTSTMIHLVALTSPYEEFSGDAKDYFTRHMRVLEQCISAWPMADLQAQIQSLREAFSADITKPFQLKASFPYGSPVSRLIPSPPIDMNFHEDPMTLRSNATDQARMRFPSQPMTPPVSAHPDQEEGSVATAAVSMMAGEHRHHTPMPNDDLQDESVPWNPTRIFDSWTTAFGAPTNITSAPGSSRVQHSPTPYSSNVSVISHQDIPTLQDPAPPRSQPNYELVGSISMPTTPTHTPLPPAPTSYPNSQSYVTPTMWQDAVSSTFDPTGSLKRRWSNLDGPVDAASACFGDHGHHQVKRPR